MDFILTLADDHILDKAWAWAFPALPRSLSGVDSSASSYTDARLGASSKVASPSSSAISNLTASIASALAGRSGAAASASENAVAHQVMDASADWQSLKGVSALARDSWIR